MSLKRRGIAFIIDLFLYVTVICVVWALFDNKVVTGATPALLWYSYFTILESKWGYTLGKKWLKMRVVRIDGSGVGLWRSLVRQLTRAVCLASIIPVLITPLTKSRKLLYDELTDTRMLDTRKKL